MQSLADKMCAYADMKLRHLETEYLERLLNEIEKSAAAGYKYCSFTLHIKGEPIGIEYRTDKYIEYLHCAECIIENVIDKLLLPEHGFGVDKSEPRAGRYGKIFVINVKWNKQK